MKSLGKSSHLLSWKQVPNNSSKYVFKIPLTSTNKYYKLILLQH